MFFYLAAAGLLSCLLLGGGTSSGHLSDAVLQLLTIPVLLAALWRIGGAPRRSEARWALAACAAILAVPLLQLIPLPPAIWTALPGRESIQTAFELLGRRPSWAPISMAPQSTWLSALALLPPLSVFLAVLTLDWRERRLLSLVTIGVAVASAFLGLTQLMEGETSPLRFFAITSPNAPVGFFANVNHFAALLYCAILLAAAWVATAIDSRRHSGRRGRDDAGSIMTAGAAAVALLILICVAVIARSRAGFILTLTGLFAALTLTAAPLREVKNLASVRLVISVMALALLFLGRPALLGVLDRFGAKSLADDERLVFARVTIEAAKALMPVGAGTGAFVPAYALFQKPEDLMLGEYVNHAHNDWLELWLETGVVGPLLLALFLYWYARKAARAWGPSNPGPLAIDRALLRAAVVIIALLLGHSLVDYPLRTSAMLAIMGLACALLIDPVAPALKAAAPPPNEAAARRGADRPLASDSRRRHGPSRRDRVS